MRRYRFRLFRRPNRPGGWYYLDIRSPGALRRREATGTTRRTDAEEYLERRRRELGDPTAADIPANQTAHSVTEAVAAFALDPQADVLEPTAKMYRVKAGHFDRLLGEVDVASLTAEHVKRYVGARRDEGAKDHTVAKELVAIRKVLALAEQSGYLQAGWRGIFPERFPTGYDPRDRWLTETEYLRLVEALDAEPENAYVAGARRRWAGGAPIPRRGLWVTVACFTGGRESELKRLTWADVDFGLGFVTLRSAKTRKGKPRRPRHIPMADELRHTLEVERGDGKLGPVFPMAWRNPAAMLTNAARRIGLVGADETLNDNDLRRTFASWMLQQGATVREVAELLGHGSTAMVERVYGHLAKANLINAVGRLPRFATRK